MAASSALKAVSGALVGVRRSELNLATTLFGGMSFRWRRHSDGARFVGVIGHRVYLLDQADDRIHFTTYSSESNPLPTPEQELRDYFRLDEDLDALCAQWAERDAKFRERVHTYPDVLRGVRVLRLSPVENLFSFICSSNNNIKRITQMVANMCVHFGARIGSVDDADFYAFPGVARLADSDVEDKLRKLSFGYRAKFIQQAAARLLANAGGDDAAAEQWLLSLRAKPYDEVHAALVELPGIGKKVADCICLMSMDKLDAIPVDTHVLNLARTLYGFDKSSAKPAGQAKNNSLTDKAYWEIADKFRELWGKHAGWAQTIMFVDDLKSFQKVKSESLTSPKIKAEPAAVASIAEIKVEPTAAVEVKVKTEPAAVKEEPGLAKRGPSVAEDTPTKPRPPKSKRRKH